MDIGNWKKGMMKRGGKGAEITGEIKDEERAREEISGRQRGVTQGQKQTEELFV